MDLEAIACIHSLQYSYSAVVILNQRHWQSLGGQRGNGVDGLFEKTSFHTVLEGVKSA